MQGIRNFWLKLSIKTKLLCYFFVIIAITSIFNVYLNQNNYEIVDQFDATMTEYYRINRLLVLSQDIKEDVESYLRERNDAYLLQYQEDKDEALILVEQIEKKMVSLEAYFLLNAIKNAQSMYYLLWDQSIEEQKNEVPSFFNAYYKGEDIWNYSLLYIEELLYIRLEEGNLLYNQLANEAKLRRQVSLVVIATSILVSMLIGYLLTNTFIEPIKKLAKTSMRISSGDLHVPKIIIKSKDEVGILGESFNTMSQSILNYVNDLKEKVVIEKRLHEEELEVIRMEQLVNESHFEALQSQINPHFLFNTLNTISRTAMFESANETLSLIQALSNLFRYKLRSQTSLIPLSEEIRIAEEYIFIQKFRFKERLRYEIITDEESLSAFVPIFMLQPIIENSIIHGIEPKVEGGKLRIKVHTQHSENRKIVVLKVTDTGIGLSKK
jgi:two-component system, sensor histidine kinase YesM